MLTRFEDWELRLDRYLADRQGQPFAWGVNDCALFTADAVLAMTGVDLAAGFRGKYASRAAAKIAIREFCAGDLEALAEEMAKRHRIQEFPYLCAQRGDVVCFLTPLGPALGIVSLDGRKVLSTGPRGPVEIPLGACQRAWRI